MLDTIKRARNAGLVAQAKRTPAERSAAGRHAALARVRKDREAAIARVAALAPPFTAEETAVLRPVFERIFGESS